MGELRLGEKRAELKDIRIPLLVRIQSVELESLEIRSHVKLKHVTFVEGTNKYLVVGCTSGTVYLFSRDKLQFLCIIPFKGGKVCFISCPEDETDIAVGSIRGKVSIFRIATTNAASPLAAAKVTAHHIYSVNHHASEITEMLWSPNGRYLFIGDSHGIVSQVDIGGLDEFPRPLISRIILQVSSRVLQIDCVFPFITVNSLNGVFLCDIESENFTRIRTPARDELQKASGVCLVTSQQVKKRLGHPVVLYVGALSSSMVHRYGSDGSFIDSVDIEANVICKDEVRIFDPKIDEDCRPSLNLASDMKLSVGKLVSCDGGCLLSVTNNQIVLLEPQSLVTFAWNGEFRRISTVKAVSNYVFIWEQGKIHVVAATFFRSYAQQLLQAKLTPLLNNWIAHSLNAAGMRQLAWDDTTETTNKETFDDFVTVLSRMLELELEQDFVEDDEICQLVVSHLPPDTLMRMKDHLYQHLEGTMEPDDGEPKQEVIELAPYSILQNHIRRYVECLCALEDLIDNPDAKDFLVYDNVLEETLSFLENVGIDMDLSEDDEDQVTFSVRKETTVSRMDKIMRNVTKYWNQKLFCEIWEELQTSRFSDIRDSFERVFEKFLTYVFQLAPNNISEVCASRLNERCTSFDFFSDFSSFAGANKWYKKMQPLSVGIQKDVLVATVGCILLPLFPVFFPPMELLLDSRIGFCTWLVAVLWTDRQRRQFPYSDELRRLFNPAVSHSNMLSCLVSNLYDQSELSDVFMSSLPNFLTLIHLKSPKSYSSKKILSSLVNSVPPKELNDVEIRDKIVKCCKFSPIVFKLFYEACVMETTRFPLCECGLPAFKGYPSTFIKPRMQKLVEEALVEVMYTTSSSKDRKQAFNFAMERLLIQRYLELTHIYGAEEMDINLEILLRSGLCELLHSCFSYSKPLLQLLFEFLSSPNLVDNCKFCGHQLKVLPNFKTVTWDCVALWMAEADTGLNTLMNEIVNHPLLNQPGLFSLRLYQVLLRIPDQIKDCKLSHDIVCSPIRI